MEPEQREDVLAKAARDGLVCYFWLASLQHPEKGGIDISCSIDTECDQNDRTFVTLAERLLADDGIDSKYCLHLRDRGPGPGFAVRRLSDAFQGTPKARSESLKAFMISNKSDFAVYLHGAFQKTDRVRLSYELSEWTLLFLKTNWFEHLCICCIYRLESDDLRTTFRARVHQRHHVNTATAIANPSRQWCQHKLLDMRIPRLGILLCEIALGIPLNDFVYHEDTGIEIKTRGSSQSSVDRDLQSTTETTRRIEQTMGRTFMRIVNYCLIQKSSSSNIAEPDVKQFQKRVVEP